jgi:hypothetical protein
MAQPISIGGLPVAAPSDIDDSDILAGLDGNDPSGATTKGFRVGDLIAAVEVGASPATSAAAVTVNPAGFVVVEGLTVQAALASIDQALASGGGGGGSVGPGGTVGALAIETTDWSAFRVKSPEDAWDIFEINVTPLQTPNPNASVFYFRSPQFPVTSVVGALARFDDYQGAPILQIFNEGGLWVNDNITMAPFYDGQYRRGLSLEYLDGSANLAPALIFGQVGNTIASVNWNGDPVTIQANKGRWIRLNDNNQLEVAGGIVPAAHNTFGLGTPAMRWSAISATVHEGAEILFPSTVVLRSQSTLLNGGNPNGQALTGGVGTKIFSQNGGTYTKRLAADDNSWILDGGFDFHNLHTGSVSLTQAQAGVYHILANNAGAAVVTLPLNTITGTVFRGVRTGNQPISFAVPGGGVLTGPATAIPQFGSWEARHLGGTSWIVFNLAGGASTVAGAPSRLPLGSKASPYTLAAADETILSELTGAGAGTLTIPTNAAVPIPVGAEFNWRQVGTGSWTFVGAAGVDLRARVGTETAGQWSEGLLTKRATNEWVLTGDLEPAAAPAAFNPLTDISWGKALWASDPLQTAPADGVALAAWRNGGTIVGDYAQATGSKQLTYRASVAALNSKPAFEASSAALQAMATPAFTTVNAPYSLVVVARSDNNSGVRAKITGVGPGAELSLDPSSALYVYAGVGINAGSATSTWHSATSFFAAALVAAGAAGKLIHGATTITGTPGTGGATMHTIGHQEPAGPDSYFDGHIVFAGLYLGDITADVRWNDFKAWVTSFYGVTA